VWSVDAERPRSPCLLLCCQCTAALRCYCPAARASSLSKPNHVKLRSLCCQPAASWPQCARRPAASAPGCGSRAGRPAQAAHAAQRVLFARFVEVYEAWSPAESPRTSTGGPRPAAPAARRASRQSAWRTHVAPPVPLHHAPLLLHAPSMSRQHPRTPQHGWRWLDACRPLCCAMPSLPSFASADKDDTGSERGLAASARLSAPPCLPAVPMQASSAHSHACCAGSSLSRVPYVCATPSSLLRTSAPSAAAGACTTPSTPATPRAAAFNRALAAVTRRPPHPGPAGEAAADGGSPLSGGAGAGSGRGSPGTAWSLGSQQGSQQGSLPGSGSQPRRPPGPCVGCAAGHPQRLLAALAAALHDLRSEFAEGAPREIAGKKQTLLAWRHRQGAAREQRWGTGPHGTRSAPRQWSRRRRVLARLWGAGGCRQARSSARTGRGCCEFCTAQCPHGCMRERDLFAGTAHAHKGFRGSAGSAALPHAPGGRKTVPMWPTCGSRLVSGLIGAA